MDFNKLSKFVKNIGTQYGVPCYDISVYYNYINVFYKKRGFTNFKNKFKAFGRNMYLFHSGAKLMCCVALMRLIECGKASLDDLVRTYIPEIQTDITIKEMMHEFSRTFDYEVKDFNFTNMTKLIEKISGQSFYEYVDLEILKPFKMKSTSFELNDKNKKHIAFQYNFNSESQNYIESDKSVEALFNKNKGCVITTVDDYSRFCNVLCSGGTMRNGYKLLDKESIDSLINDILYNETEKNDAFVCLGYNGGLILIDIKKKITIVYAQHAQNMPAEQLKMYPQLRKLTYECIGVDTWSKGYNMFP